MQKQIIPWLVFFHIDNEKGRGGKTFNGLA